MPKVNPSMGEVYESEPEKTLKSTLTRVLLWDKARHPSGQNVPVWSCFNQILISSKTFSQASDGYLPPITAPPTQMNGIYEDINRIFNVREELELRCIILEIDQAIQGTVC